MQKKICLPVFLDFPTPGITAAQRREMQYHPRSDHGCTRYAPSGALRKCHKPSPHAMFARSPSAPAHKLADPMEPYKAVAKDRRSDSRVDGEKKLQLWLHAIPCCRLLLLSSLLNKLAQFSTNTTRTTTPNTRSLSKAKEQQRNTTGSRSSNPNPNLVKIVPRQEEHLFF